MRASSSTKSLIIAAVGIAALIFGGIGALGMGFAFADGDPGEPTIPTDGTIGGVSCAAWANAPDGYQDEITRAANKVGIQPALLGAIFLSEHGNSWPNPTSDPGSDGIWNQGGNGRGPFQIETWANYWQQVQAEGYNEGRDSATASVEDLYDSGIAISVSMLVGFKKYNIDPMTTEQKDILYAGLIHNRGRGAAEEWASAGFDITTPPTPPTQYPDRGWGTDKYAFRVWDSFNDLNDGCDVLNLVPDGSGSQSEVVRIALAEVGKSRDSYHSQPRENCTTYAPGGGCAGWCAYFATWVYKQAYPEMPIKGGPADVAAWFKANHTWISQPSSLSEIKEGDIFVTYGEGVSGLHMGIVVENFGANVATVEGNTAGSYASGGDKVSYRTYRRLSDFNRNANYGVGRWGKASE